MDPKTITLLPQMFPNISIVPSADADFPVATVAGTKKLEGSV